MRLLAGRTAIITGAAQGLGYSIASAFVDEGARVVLGDIRGDQLRDGAERLGPSSTAIAREVDVTSADDVVALVAAAEEAFGSVDIMVNNAGLIRDATMRKMSEDSFDAVIDVHLKGSWLGTRAASDAMRRLGIAGSIINMSSISGKVGNAGQTNYSAAKAGIVGLTKAAAKEVGFAGIRVNAIQPGTIETAMTAAMPDDIRAARLKDVPLGRFGTPAEVASVAVFLSSAMSSYLTGTVIEVAGGRHI
jgi:3-oxoacyl-[acyl-carrier protein] reductase